MSGNPNENKLTKQMCDGSFHFASFDQTKGPLRLFFRVFTLWGAYPLSYIPSYSETWIEFSYNKQRFSIHNPMGEFWFFVEDPNCPDFIIDRVKAHFERILKPRMKHEV